jgi:U3 small nucleolar RNA-associated protein 25
MAPLRVSVGSYGDLLRQLNASKQSASPSKRRKLQHSSTEELSEEKVAPTKEQEHQFVVQSASDNSLPKNGHEIDADGDNVQLEDPFAQHFLTTHEVELQHLATRPGPKRAKVVNSDVEEGVRRSWIPSQEKIGNPVPATHSRQLHLKSRLLARGRDVFDTLSSLERDLAGSLFSYRDVVAGVRTVRNAHTLRDISMLHCLNHVLKTRDRVLKNNTKLASADGAEAVEARDQGFTRPKVLIIVPTKQGCVRMVDSIVKLSEPDQQENRSRFMDQFHRVDEDEWQGRPEDFRELFGGNHEEDFRIGLKFTRKTIKFFSGFYNSDIIIASPLGLTRAMAGSTREEDDEKKEDSDFLSSIEIVLADNVSALQMQNWQHVEHVFSKLNLLPKDSHGCDFSRVRHWYLDGHAKFLRQTIILSAYLTPEISALASAHLHNIVGRIKYTPRYKGSITEVMNVLPMTVHQTFIRIDALNAVVEAEARFKLFTTTILPQLVREDSERQGTLIYTSAYDDFLRVRNHLSSSLEGSDTLFASISEYTPVKEVNRARSYFISGRNSLLLYSERAHHHFRYRLRGVRRIIFYGIPENPIFWVEIVALLGMDEGTSLLDKQGKGLVRALFSKWDAMKLERIVGTDRVATLLAEKAGDTFDFV